ncbi:Rqc2 family fibronectin-binding protein [Paenibacillus sp. FA6]|uniref:Rqc2 family fibronectin-binding protein n=1 Tax=Paenibacillus sp. FA6 TaxID=3413029 RepID=UPI003F65AA5D
MALDGSVTRAIVQELQIYKGARINKIYQPNSHDILFNLRSREGNSRLLLSANPTFPRVQLTEKTFLNPQEAPMFCMLMRKHCESGTIEDIQQVGMERIIHISIRQRDELGDVSLKKIIIELMGRHSNIILMDTSSGIILDGIHHVTPAISSFRIVMPGASYTEPPEQHKRNPLEVDQAAFIEAYMGTEQEPISWIVDSFSGLSPLVAQEIVFRASQEQDPNVDEDRISASLLWSAFSHVMEPVAKHEYQPVIGTNAKGKLVFSAILLTMLNSEVTHYHSISECLEEFYGDKAERDTVKQKVSDLLRFLHNERAKNLKKLDHLHEDIIEAGDADQYRIWGELIFASLHLIHKGDKTVELTNFYDEEQAMITVPLDPLISPTENAQRYFKKYNKYKNSLVVIDQQLIKTREEIRYMDDLLQQLSYASMNDIEEIREELIQQQYLRDRSKKSRKKKVKKKTDRPTLHVFTSSEGIEIYVGKNNLQNEYVTNRLASPNDTWLHTKDIPGSHVVIRSEKFGEATLDEAAQLAAYFSQAKESSSVPVDTTLIRHVRKPSGSKPGFVIYDHQKTLFVTPDERRIKDMPSIIKN